ncbi:MAG: FtsX-like permease family protein [Candidatus Altimarinota bacterium]
MLSKITKITLKTGEKYFVFVFLAVFLSLFSYILGNNIVLSVKDYLQEQIKPLVGGDMVLSNREDLDESAFREKYENTFEIAKNISINSTLFDENKNPNLVELVYHTPNYPFYNQFEYEIINQSGSLIVNQATLDKYGKNIEILGKNYQVKGIIKKSPIGDISLYANQNTLYLPIDQFDANLNASNSRLEYNYYLLFQGEYDERYKEILSNDVLLKDFRVRSLNDRNDYISDTTDRFYVFINFFNLVVFVLTFFIVILSLETFFKKIKGTLGLLNIFGLQKKKIFLYNFIVLFFVFFVGFILAYLLNVGIMSLLTTQYDFFQSKLESFYKGFGVTIILLLVGIFSPMYKIFKSDISALLKDEGNFSHFNFTDYVVYLGLIFSGFLGVNLISGISMFESFLYSFLFIFIIVLFYVGIEKILHKNFSFFFLNAKNKFFKNFYIFDAIRSTIKPGNVSFLIIFSGIISFISIFIFYVFSGSFLSYLGNITQSSNDTFVINVQKDDLQTVEKYFSSDEIFEIVTLRIQQINGKTLQEFLGQEKVPRQFGREFSSTTKDLENKILSGEKLSVGGVSVDREFASELGLKIGDEITFTVAGLEKTLKVVNFREAVRNGTNPFFYFQLDVSDFEKYPKNYIISYKESEKPQNLENTLSKELGNHLTFIKTREIVEIVINIANKILIVVYVCLSYIFIFSFLSFIVSLSFLSTFKTAKIKLLNILGGKKESLVSALSFEFGYLVCIGLLFSILFGSLFLLILFYFIKYFSLHLFSYFIGIMILLGLFMVMIGFVYLKNKFLKI